MIRKYYELNEENRISLTADMGRLIEQDDGSIVEAGEQFDFPDNFDFAHQSDYKMIDGELLYDPLPEEETEEAPSYDDRIQALEKENAELKEALDLILSGVTE